MTVRTGEARTRLIEAGRRLAAVLAALKEKVAPGVSAETLDDLAEEFLRDDDCIVFEKLR